MRIRPVFHSFEFEIVTRSLEKSTTSRCSRRPAMPRMPSTSPTRCGSTTGTCSPSNTSAPASSFWISTAGTTAEPVTPFIVTCGAVR